MDCRSNIYSHQVSLSIEQILTENEQMLENHEVNKDYICSIGHHIMLYPMRTRCNHIFEKICIHEWLKKNSTCPLDREKITKSELVLDRKLQKEISDYLAENSVLRQKNLEHYKELIMEYKANNQGILEYISLQFSRRFFSEQNWRITLHRTHNVAVVCLIISASMCILTNFLGLDQEATPLGLLALKNGSIYFVYGSSVLATATSKTLLNCLNALQDRRHSTD